MERGVNWHREAPPDALRRWATNGSLGSASPPSTGSGAASPFGDDVAFPMPPRT